MLTDKQTEVLLAPLHPSRIQKRAKSGTQLSYLAAWDVRRTLTRIFGIGNWRNEILSCDLVNVREITVGKAKNPGYEVVYRVTMRLTIYSLDGQPIQYWEDGAIGSNISTTLGDAHDTALKSAMSDALKRCAVNLGDQFGLSLYNNGRLEPTVIRTLQQDTETEEPLPEAVDGDTEIEPTSEVAQVEPAVSYYQHYSDALTSVITTTELQAIGAQISASKASGQLTMAELEALNTEWKNRRQTLKDVS